MWEYNCDWVQNNHNFDNEIQVDDVSSPDECISQVALKCPNATIANVEIGNGSLECYCQFGTDMSLDVNAGWLNCLLSTLGNPQDLDIQNSKRGKRKFTTSHIVEQKKNEEMKFYFWYFLGLFLGLRKNLF